MAIVVARDREDKNFLTVVGEVLMGAGENAPTALANAEVTVKKAIRACNEAVVEIYDAAQWSWRKDWHDIQLAAKGAWYSKPPDFDEFAADIPVYGGSQKLEYTTYQNLIELYPDFQSWPPGADAAGEQITRHRDAIEDSSTPIYYTEEGNYFGLYPPPGADYVAEQYRLILPYYKDPAEMIYDSDMLDLPYQFFGIHYRLALGRLKMDMGMQDYQGDIAMGREGLELKIRRRKRKTRNKPALKDSYLR